MHARTSRTMRRLAPAVLCLGLAGCRSFPADAPSSPARIESFSAVSDRPDAVLSKKSNSPRRISSRVDPVPSKAGSESAVTGRVVDAQGIPVANARVRLAFDGSSGGREIQGVSDRNGTFRLSGLRPDASYTLIAEWEDEREVLVGRKRVQGQAQSVEIKVRNPQDDSVGFNESLGYQELSSRQSRGGGLYRDIIPGQSEVEPELRPSGPGAARLASGRRSRDGDLEEAQALPPVKPEPLRRSASVWKAGTATALLAESSRVDPVLNDPVLEPNRGVKQQAEANPLPPAREPRSRESLSSNAPDAPSSSLDLLDNPGPAPLLLPPPIAPEVAPPPEPSPAQASQVPGPSSVDMQEETATLPTANPSFGQANPPPIDSPSSPPRQDGASHARPAALPPQDELSDAPPVVVSPSVPSTLTTEPAAGQTDATPDAASQVAELKIDSPTEPPSTPGAFQLEESPATVAEPVAPDLSAAQGSGEMAEPTASASDDPKSVTPGGESVPMPADPFQEGEERGEGAGPLVRVEHGPPITWDDLPPPSVLKASSLSSDDAAPRRPISMAASRNDLAPGGIKKWGARLLSPWTGPGVEPACRFDPRSQRIAEFVLPDLQGKAFRRSEVQSQNILLVFWGSWSEACVQTVSRVDKLQEHFDPSRLQVVAVAYEKAEPAERAEVVGSLARRLGLDFPILIGPTDGSCPLQNALKVEYYPTFLLLDQYGRIQWRGTGAGADVLTRLERAVTFAAQRAQPAPTGTAAPVAREGSQENESATKVR